MNLTFEQLTERLRQADSLGGAPHALWPAPPPATAAAPAPGEAAPSQPTAEPCFQICDYASRGYHLEATVAPDQVTATAELLDRNGFAIDVITGVDWIAAGQMEVVYDYFHPVLTARAVVRTRIPRDNPQIASISGIFPGANWHERETHDFFGIHFIGHPDLSPLLLPEDATYHPLRKDFSA